MLNSLFAGHGIDLYSEEAPHPDVPKPGTSASRIIGLLKERRKNTIRDQKIETETATKKNDSFYSQHFPTTRTRRLLQYQPNLSRVHY